MSNRNSWTNSIDFSGNYGYEWCARRLFQQDVARLDLHHVANGYWNTWWGWTHACILCIVIVEGDAIDVPLQCSNQMLTKWWQSVCNILHTILHLIHLKLSENPYECICIKKPTCTKVLPLFVYNYTDSNHPC